MLARALELGAPLGGGEGLALFALVLLGRGGWVGGGLFGLFGERGGLGAGERAKGELARVDAGAGVRVLGGC